MAFEPNFMDDDWFAIINYCIDVIFLIDIFITFRTVYIDDLGNVIKTQDNNGTSNTLVIPSKPGEFRDYEWFVDDLPEFQAFAIKIVMTGTNQAEPPRIRDLKAIAVR